MPPKYAHEFCFRNQAPDFVIEKVTLSQLATWDAYEMKINKKKRSF